MKKKKLLMTRRQLLKAGMIGGAGMMLPWQFNLQKAFAEYVGENTLDGSTVNQFVAQMVIPPAMPLSKGSNKNKDKYDIAVRQFGQQILPSPRFGPTTVWSYGNRDFPGTVGELGTFNYPAFTIEATADKVTQVLWRNELVDAKKKPLPHLLPVDPTLHWANPIGQRDTRPNPADAAYWANPYLNGENGSYTGPVPMVVHVHGAHTTEDSDGYPEAWYLPATAKNVDWLKGTYFDIYNDKYGHGWKPGTVSFKYPNTQRATTLWYHDHTLGMTRLNVYAGPAGFWLIRGGPDDIVTVKGTSNPAIPAILPGPAPGIGDSPFGNYYEIPIVFQDRSFDTNGQLWYPYYRAFFEGLGDLPDPLQIPFTPDLALNGLPSDVAPIWLPEFFGDVMVVNGVSWPYQPVEQQLYRLRLLNGCNSRFLILDFNLIPGVQVWQIGAEGGFLSNPVDITNSPETPILKGNQILMGLAERADVIVDFRNVPPGDYNLRNFGPDEPFGGEPLEDRGDMPQMRYVMQFRVSAGSVFPSDTFTDPDNYVLPAIAPLTPTVTRELSLNEEMSHAVYVPFDAGEDEFVLATDGNLYEVGDSEAPTEGPRGTWTLGTIPGVKWDQDWSPSQFGPTSALLGTMSGSEGNPLLWMDPVTENPAAGTTETWNIHNLTVDAHPIHIHLVQFQVVGRKKIGGGTSVTGSNEPLPTEDGFKDTVIAYPEEITTVKAKFDIPGRFVWHCHIVEHEDNEMMRPYDIV